MSSREQAWSSELQDLFSYSPPAIEKANNPTCYRLPSTFFDRHLDLRLSLRRVVSVPSFTADIAEVIDHTMLLTKNEGGCLPDINYKDGEERSAFFSKSGRSWGDSGNKLTDATSVAQFYIEVSLLYCSPVGSTFALNPHCYTWLNIFRFNWASIEPDEGRSSTIDKYYLEIRQDDNAGNMQIPKGIWNALDEDGRADLAEMFARFRRLVTYQFCAATTEYDELLEKMDDICGKEPISSFPEDISGFPTEELPLAPLVDSTILPWRPRESKRIGSSEKQAVVSLEQEKDERTKSPQNNRSSPHSKGITVNKITDSVDDVTTFIKHVSICYPIIFH